MKLKTLAKRHTTKHEGVYTKEIVNEDGKVKDTLFMIRWRDENNIDRQKNIGKKSEGINLAFCKIKRDEIVVKKRLGEDAPAFVKPKSGTTLDEAYELYYDYNKNKVSAKRERKRYYSTVSPTFGNKYLDNITKKDIIDFRDKRATEVAPKTANLDTMKIATVYNFMVREKLYKGDIPTVGVDRLKGEVVRTRYFTVDEINKILEVSLDNNYEVWLFVKLALSTGGRVGTVMDIRANDIDQTNGIVTLRDFKKSDTTIYKGFVDDDLLSALKERISDINPTDHIIKLHQKTVVQKLKVIIDTICNIGIPKKDSANRAVIHSLRHTFASHLAINGVSIFKIQKLMNHNSIEHTMRYAKLAPDSGADEVKNLYK